MCEVLPPREAAEWIAKTSKDVTVKDEGVANVAKLMLNCVKENRYNIKSWKEEHELNIQKVTDSSVDWVFVADTLNFSFWSDDETKKYSIQYKDKTYTGYWSWVAALNKAIDNGVPITDPHFYANISVEKLKEILKSDSAYDIPMLEERVRVLQEAGKVLVEKYKGSFINCIQQCDKSAQKLLKLVVSEFPSYNDVAMYGDKKVAFYKRAQILIADIWACFEGQGHGEFQDIDTITMFADYRIPQALVHFGAMKYSEQLTEYLKSGHMMKTGDQYEMEIRGCSIWATELINIETRKLLQECSETKDALMNSILIDHYLWDFRRDHAEEMRDIPFHRIRCIYY